MLLDREGETSQAMQYYERSYNKYNLKNILDPSQMNSCFVKAATNLAVCYEKLGFREKAIELSEILREKGIVTDAKLNNNLGVLFKRD